MQVDINNPLIHHAAIDMQKAEFKQQIRINNLLKLNLLKLKNNILAKNKTVYLDRYFNFVVR